MSANANLPTKILIVDDDPAIAQGLEEPLGRYKIAVLKATTLETAYYQFNQHRLDVVVVESGFAPLSGLALIQKWRNHDVVEKRATAFIVTTGTQRTPAEDGLIRELGDLEVIAKPFNAINILPYLSRGLGAKQRALAFDEMKSRLVEPWVKHGNLDKAVEQVQKKVTEIGPKAMYLLYDLYEKAGKYDQALGIVDQVLDRDTNNIALISAKARLYMRTGKIAEARDLFERADKVAPDNIERINEMVGLYLRVREPDASVRKMKELIALTPENPDLKFEMFSKLYDHGFDSHAVEFGRATSKPMEIVRHYNNKGVLLSKSGNSAGAVTEYQRALQFFPKFKENYRILYNIALAKSALKTPDAVREAILCLEQCLQLEPEFDKAKKALETLTKLATPKKAV